MAIVKVYYDSKEFDIDNGLGKDAVLFDGEFIKRGFRIQSYILHDWGLTPTIEADIEQYDYEPVSGYEKTEDVINVRFELDGSYFTNNNLKTLDLKMRMINEGFKQIFGIEPINLDGTVKAEYATAP